MKKIVAILLSACILIPALFAGGTKELTGKESHKPLIAVSILPQQFVVDTIAGNLIDTVVLVGPGQNPHSYEPTPKQMSSLALADAWILSGTDFEHALHDKIESLYPNLLLVDGTEGVTFRYLEDHDHEAEEGVQESDQHGLELDRHTWLGQEPMKILATKVTETLVALDAEHAGTYRENLAAFHTEVDTLFDTLKRELAPMRGSTVFVYHPSFGYLLDDLGIYQEAVETGGKEPTPRTLSALIERAQEDAVKAIFVQAQFPTNAAENVANAIGAEVVPLDPLAYDWITNITLIGERLSRAVRK